MANKFLTALFGDYSAKEVKKVKKISDKVLALESKYQEMSDKELITITIDRYAELQRIKQSNGTQENKELDYSIKLAVAKLSSLGVNVEDITL